MAAANMKAVKLRIKSVQNTMQITKAMQLVAASKLRKAKEKADSSKPYLQTMRETLTTIANENTDFQSPYTREGASEKWLYIVIAGDRGLAGGYNANLFKFMEAEVVRTEGEGYAVLPIGKKSVEYFQRRKTEIFTEEYAEVAKVTISDCYRIAKAVCDAYRNGDFGHVALCYTNFVSMMSQVPGSSALLPLSDFSAFASSMEEARTRAAQDGAGSGSRGLILYEPASEEVFNTIVPEYLAGILYTSINVSVASELAARRTAMEAATDNASEMIEKLNLFYNRARQASITQEITEIVAGAEGT
ncbi:MAG: ATP synthase F1 subunit gamma [Eubacteriales bacterium]|nr:ATP synthase F1 subunit gamma [Sarcina sp.]MDO4418089.1 ATP synthase F1 subunit gamma [Eubacteriales bacterium]